MRGDFLPEFVVNSWNASNPMLFWELTGSSEDRSLSKHVVGALNGHGTGFGDLNGDGREDLLFQGGGGMSVRLISITGAGRCMRTGTKSKQVAK